MISAEEWLRVIHARDLDDLADELGYDVVERGTVMMRCPSGSHTDKIPSAQVNLEAKRQNFYCHTCGARGDALALIAYHHGLDVKKNTVRAWYLLREIVDGKSSMASPRPIIRPHHEKPVMPQHLQRKAVEMMLRAIDEVCGESGLADAGRYLVSRGLPEIAVKPARARLVRRHQWARIGDAMGAANPIYEAAGLTRKGDDGIAKPLWWDDALIGVNTDIEERPAYLWGRRINPCVTGGKYINQGVRGGATKYPFNLRAISVARKRGMRLRVVEGPLTALGSIFSGERLALPTLAVMGRIQATDSTVSTLCEAIGAPDIEVELSPDSDRIATKEAKGRELANELARALKLYGIDASVKTPGDHGVVGKDYLDGLKFMREFNGQK